MTRITNCLKYILFTLLLALPFYPISYSQTFSGEHIANFDVDIVIEESGHISVTEKIQYYFGTNLRHGIFRNIPFVKTNDKGDRLLMDITDISVTDENNKPLTTKVSKDGEETDIRIGDADKEITGMHTYFIKYRVAGALSYFEDFDELYWDLTGDDWTVEIQNFSGRVSLPPGIIQTEPDVTTAICYTGPEGSTLSECDILMTTENRISYEFLNQKPYLAGEGITVAVTFPKGYVQVLHPRPDIMYTVGKIVGIFFVILAVILWGFVAPIVTFWIWYKDHENTKNKQKIVAAWFSPPKNRAGQQYSPAETGLLLSKGVGPKLITATIIDLAQRGFLKIVFRNKNDYDFVKLKELTAPELKTFERTLLAGLFSDVQGLNLGRIIKSVDKFKKMSADGTIDEAEQAEISELATNTLQYVTVNIKDLKKSNIFAQKVESFYRQLGIAVKDDGLFTKDPVPLYNFFTALTFFSWILFNPIMSVFSLFFGRKIAPRTDFGIEKYSEAKSLENFLKSQDAQLDFQAYNQMFFEKLLPYATAYGVEDVWAKRFKDLNFSQSDWYEGGNYGAMQFSSFSHGLSSSVRSYSSTSSSGSSGGSSGGGGGGGGGGSW